MQKLWSSKVKEEVYIDKLENGLTVIVIPKKNTSKKYVIWGTEFGSVDNHFYSSCIFIIYKIYSGK